MKRQFYSEYFGKAFVLYCSHQNKNIVPKIEVKIEILQLRNLSKEILKEVRKFSGYIPFAYLRFTYGSPETYLALVWVGSQIAHISWVSPYKKCRKHMPVIPKNACMIGPAVTAPVFRGNGIFPFVLQQINCSALQCDEYWVLVNKKNYSSIKSIEKAGAKHLGLFTQRRYFWGCMKTTKYYPDKS